MDSNAQMSCMMRVDVHCDGCKRQMMEVLQNLKGVYSVVLDAEQGTVRVIGKVNPTTILNVFDKYGKHGEVSSLRFDGEVMEQIPYSFYGDNPYNPHEVPYPPIPIPIPYHFFRGPEQQLYGRNPYPMPPPLLGTMPPPPWPPPPQQYPPPPPLPQHQQQQQPSPVSKAPSAPPAPLPPDPKCCTIM